MVWLRGSYSTWRTVYKWSTTVSVLGPVLLASVNLMEYTHQVWRWHKLCTLEDKAAVRRVLGRLGVWAKRKLMIFGKGNAESCTWDGEPFATVQAGDKLAKEHLGEKDLGVVPLDTGSKGSHQHPRLFKQEHNQ